MPPRTRTGLLLASLALLVTLGSQRAEAGPWTRDQWHFFLGLGSSFTLTDTRYDTDGNKKDITVRKFSPGAGGSQDTNKTSYQQLSSDLYFEIGLLKHFTVFGDLTFTSARMHNIDVTGASVSPGDIQYSTNKLGDTLLGARYGILVNPFALAIETRFTLPTGDSIRPLPSGSGDFRTEVRLAAGKSFSTVPIYFDVEFGFAYRTAGEVLNYSAATQRAFVQYAPEIAVHAELGGVLLRWRRQDRLQLIVAVDFRTSTSHTSGGNATFELVPSDSEMTTVGPTLIGYLYKGLGVMARYTQAVEGKRLPNIATAAASIFYSY